MTEEELRALVEDVLGLHNTHGQADTIVLAAKSYAAAQVAASQGGNGR